MTMTGAVVMTATTTMRCRYDDGDVEDDVDGNTLTVADCDMRIRYDMICYAMLCNDMR